MEQDDKIVKKTWTDPVTGKFVKGNPGGGRPLGKRDFMTDFEEVVADIAKEKGITVQEARKQIIKSGIKYTLEGSATHYKDLTERVYGKELQMTDITSGGQPIPILNVQRDNSDNKDTQTI